MPNLKSKNELNALSNTELIKYLESIDKETFNSYIDADTKVRFFLSKFGSGIINAIKGTNLFFPAVVAQSILESGYGRNIPTDSNNFGGIKYNPSLNGVIGYVLSDTAEVVNGRKIIVPNTKFSKFSDVETGFKAHIQVLLSSRYDNARKAKSPEEQILLIAKSGYTSTPPNDYLKSMQGNINRVRDKTKIAKVN